MSKDLSSSTSQASQAEATMASAGSVSAEMGELNILRKHDAKLTLEDGLVASGYSFGAPVSVCGEVVFNTGMVGYPEALTDPSYEGQILVLTFPLVGNYGVPDLTRDEYGMLEHFESEKIHVAGLIVTDYTEDPSHWQAKRTLCSWLKEHGIPAIFGVDTRALTKHLRTKGSLLGKIEYQDETIELDDPNAKNLVAVVSRKEPVVYGAGRAVKILAVDCGMKNNIARYLLKSKSVELKIVPWDYDFTEEPYDGLFISNGPGDPALVTTTVEYLKKVLAREDDNRPIFGVCMGNQLLGLAAGAKTHKLPFGNRGLNQPVIDLRTTLCYITSQNHGYAIVPESLPAGWKQLFVNANDFSNEGIIHEWKPFFSAQFHPEAQGGPLDTEFLFDMFFTQIKDKCSHITTVNLPPMSPLTKKVLLLGSGGLSIGQAGEFDYSGSQAIKGFKEENMEVILVNPNIATVQTSEGLADKVYYYAVTPTSVEAIIARERPDSIALQFGGQTALNCGMALHDSGILAKYGVRVLGTPIETIRATEDREIFAQKLAEIDEKVAPSGTAESVQEALKVAAKIGYPVLVRSAFSLGGLGSGFAENEETLRHLCLKAFTTSPQVILDKSLQGWKEIEYEVVRDIRNNCITVCNMENFDPLGIHTGDSIVVAPSQTLSNDEYFRLRLVALKVVRHLGVIGECNIQYAVDPKSNDYCIIEVNARLSRSSALASKATGYPLAYVATKLALGKTLTDLRNSITKVTCACFEPALDYVVVKIPRWDLRKFAKVSSLIGSAMKSVGEVMAIGRTFEEAFQKAIRMVDGSIDGFGHGSYVRSFTECDKEELESELAHPSDRRIFALAAALYRGYTVKQLNTLTNIDPWFLHKLRSVIEVELAMKKLLSQRTPSAISPEYVSLEVLDASALRRIKQMGFSDCAIARIMGTSEQLTREYRKRLGVIPVVKQVDTLAAEFPASTNYLYMTYHGTENDISFNDNGVIVLGCGAYRIGSSCEFDWCAVSCVRTLRSCGKNTIVINFNPETVSTDYDECDRLYFEELSLERVLDIYEREVAEGIVLSVGGQIPNNLALPLQANGVNILGTSASSIDQAEDRSKFSRLLDSLGVGQPAWKVLSGFEEALDFADEIGYPVLVRPSYVLSGAAMNVAQSKNSLVTYLEQAVGLDNDAPVVISKFIHNAKEIEYDAVAMNGNILNYAISEHVENAGVHSGDATLVLPAQKLYIETLRRVKRTAALISKALNITGPFNIQFMSRNNDIMVIECNLRASRSFPFVSKTFNTNFISLATRAMIGLPVHKADIRLLDIDYVCVKVPMFSFTRLQGADPVLRVEMSSTGEVAAFGDNVHSAYISALLATNFKLPPPGSNIVLSAGPIESKVDFLPAVQALIRLGYKLYATRQSYLFYKEQGIPIQPLVKPSEVQNSEASEGSNNEKKAPHNIVEFISSGQVSLVVNIPNSDEVVELTDGYRIRRATVDFSVPLITNIKCAVLFVEALEKMHQEILALSEGKLQLAGSFTPKPSFLANVKALPPQFALDGPGSPASPASSSAASKSPDGIATSGVTSPLSTASSAAMHSFYSAPTPTFPIHPSAYKPWETFMRDSAMTR